MKPKYERGIIDTWWYDAEQSCEAEGELTLSRQSAPMMAAYLLKRILLIIPTLFGIMLISFAIIQFAPGGPVERIIAQITGTRRLRTARIGGSQGDGLSSAAQSQSARAPATVTSKYRGAQGLDPEFIKSLEKQFGFDKPAHERFFLMMKNYLTVRLRQELLPRRQRAAADQGEAARLGLARHLDDADHLPDLHPARHPQGRARRRAVRHLDVGRAGDRLRHSGLPVGGAPAGPVRRRLVLPVVPLARPDVGQLGPALARRQGRSTISGI